MHLVERYVNEISRRLPKAKRQDISEELRSTLADALDSRSSGEPTEDDVVAVLEELGPPEEVAASYSGDRYLIGPQLYPQFVTTLKIAATVIAALVVLGSAGSVLRSSPGLESFGTRIAALLSGFVNSAFTSLGIVVIVFALLERLDLGGLKKRRLRRWDPRTLPVVRDADLVPRFESIAGIVFPAIFLGLLNQFKHHIGLVVQDGGQRFQLGAVSDPAGGLLLNDVLMDNLLWINASVLLPMALSVWLFWSGRWHLVTRLLKIGCGVFGLYVTMRVCQGLVASRPDLLSAGLPERVIDIVVRMVDLVPIVVAVVVVVEGGQHLYRAWKSLV